MKQEPKNESGGSRGGEGEGKVSFLPYPLLALSLTPFFARSLTLVPRSLLLNRAETLATRAKSQFKRGLLAPPGAPLFMSSNAGKDILVPFGQHWGPKDRNSENENVFDID